MRTASNDVTFLCHPNSSHKALISVNRAQYMFRNGVLSDSNAGMDRIRWRYLAHQRDNSRNAQDPLRHRNHPEERSSWSSLGFTNSNDTMSSSTSRRSVNSMEAEEFILYEGRFHGYGFSVVRRDDIQAEREDRPLRRKTATDLAVHQFEYSDVRGARLHDQNSCTVCLMEFAENDDCALLPCLHVFHRNCISQWLHESNSCPVCRYEMPSDDIEGERRRIIRMKKLFGITRHMLMEIGLKVEMLLWEVEAKLLERKTASKSINSASDDQEWVRMIMKGVHVLTQCLNVIKNINDERNIREMNNLVGKIGIIGALAAGEPSSSTVELDKNKLVRQVRGKKYHARGLESTKLW